MGTPGDQFPIDKVVDIVPSSEIAPQVLEEPRLPASSSDPSQQLVTSDMTVLQNVPALGIFVEHDDKGLLLDPGAGEPQLSLASLEVLEKQLLFDTTTTSESDTSSTNVPSLQFETFSSLPSTSEDFFDQPSTSRDVLHQLTLTASTSQQQEVLPDLSLPGPSGLQTPKLLKATPPPSIKAAPKRNKKPVILSQLPKNPYLCTVCNKNFQTIAKLSSHQLIHAGGTPFKCEHCKKSFSSKFKLVRHVLIHSDRKPFSCTVCERTFHRKDHLKNHIKVHSPSKKIYICERVNCKKEYTSVMNYRKHLALHAAEEGSLECKICLKLFETKADILYHLKIHAGSRTVKNPNEKKFTCDYCDRKFFTRKDVRRHLVVHTGTRNFLCQFCPQRFGRKDHLVRHIKKSHSKNFTETLETSTSEEIKAEPKLEIPHLEVESLLDLGEKSTSIKLEEIPEVQNLLFSRSFTELSPMLCSEPPEGLQFISHSSSEPELPSSLATADTELLTELDVMKEELDVGEQQLLPSDMIDSDLLRLISESSNPMTDDDENNMPLPGFSQAFKQQEPPPPS